MRITVLIIFFLLIDPKAGDYFGLITMGSIMPEELQIYTCNDIRRPEALFDISVTNNGTDWVNYYIFRCDIL